MEAAHKKKGKQKREEGVGVGPPRGQKWREQRYSTVLNPILNPVFSLFIAILYYLYTALHIRTYSEYS
jgi:hypothetical protein